MAYRSDQAKRTVAIIRRQINYKIIILKTAGTTKRTRRARIYRLEKPSNMG